mmetsp:Transcript_21473/g.72257  ORF Transcript_21473/g.72257 Transcript_21473/m.72257 type:complete len:204 (+) Transcript_21473:152-763(+)
MALASSALVGVSAVVWRIACDGDMPNALHDAVQPSGAKRPRRWAEARRRRPAARSVGGGADAPRRRSSQRRARPERRKAAGKSPPGLDPRHPRRPEGRCPPCGGAWTEADAVLRGGWASRVAMALCWRATVTTAPRGGPRPGRRARASMPAPGTAARGRPPGARHGSSVSGRAAAARGRASGFRRQSGGAPSRRPRPPGAQCA